MSKREPKHIGEVMSDIAERYNKLTKTKMSKIIKSQKMIKEGLLTIELMDGTIIQCTNNDDFKLKYNQNKEYE